MRTLSLTLYLGQYNQREKLKQINKSNNTFENKREKEYARTKLQSTQYDNVILYLIESLECS